MQPTQDEVVAIIRRDVEKAPSLRAWARAHRVSAAYVSDVLSGRRAPGGKILRYFGLRSRKSVTVDLSYEKVK